MTRQEALRLRALIERGTTTYDMTEAAFGTILMPTLRYDGSLIEYKTRVGWYGVTMMARTALYDREENDPDHAPNLWAAIRQKDGIRYIEQDMVAELAFDNGERGWWENELYESQMAGNVYTPATAPTAWRKVDSA